MHINQNHLYQKISNPLLYFCSFFLSCVLLGGSSGISLGVFWMLAVVVAALSSGMELALSTHIVLMVQYALLILPKDSGFYRFLAYILLGLVVALLFSQLKDKKAVAYLALILAACDGVLQCVVFQFNLVKMSADITGIIVELISILVFVGIGFVYLQKCAVAVDAVESEAEASKEATESVTDRDVAEEKTEEVIAEVTEMEVEATAEEAVVDVSEMEVEDTYEEAAVETAELEVEDSDEETTVHVSEIEVEATAEERRTEESEKTETEEFVLQRVTEPGYELMERLKAYSDILYTHSERISLLSEKAARVIGGNAQLAKAAGMYHELGRVENESDYIEAGTKIGQEHGFSDELLAVMRQHSTGFELPKSAEAAIVMLSDCIISTSDFLAKSGKREKISDKQLVTSIFQNRLNKGNLEQSGMTEEQIQTLKEFYIENTFVKVDKEEQM